HFLCYRKKIIIMIIERNIFHLKFGKAKEAIAIWKQVIEEGKNVPGAPEMRLLSDYSGPAYTLVVELHIKSFTDMNMKGAVWVTTEKFKELYQQFIPLCESAHREFYKIEAMS
ncbi:MAG: hypothetical protein ABI855_13340, partial [Bacteroidota bacterium]